MSDDRYMLAGLDPAELGEVLAPFGASQIDDVYPLSALQTGILFQAIQHPDRGDYAAQNAYRIHGVLDYGKFDRAWQFAIGRHAALRTTFAWENLRHPVQVVHRSGHVPLRALDWRDWDKEAIEDGLSRLMAADRAAQPELRYSPPTALRLIRVAEEEHLLLWQQHHIVLDGWSTSIVLSEVCAAYESLVTDGTLPSLPPEIPFSQHIAWLRDRDQAADMSFWRETLSGFSAATRISFIMPGEPHGDGRVVKRLAPVTGDLARRLQDFARHYRLTLNTIIQGAWSLVLSRHSGDRDVLHGAVMAGRSGDQPGIESMVGMLANTVPVRVDVDPDATVASWLGRLQRHLSAVRKLEHCGLADVRRFTAVKAGSQLFDTIVNFTGLAPAGEMSAAGLRLMPERTYEQIGYPLGLTVAMQPDGLLLQLGYEAGRVAEAEAERFFGHYQHVLTQLAQEDCPLRDIPLLSDAERDLVTRHWAGTVGEPGRAKREGTAETVGALFEQAADRHPGHVALVSAGQEWTYARLDAEATRLSHVLRSHGVTTDQRVGVALPRSAEMIVAMLAIVKAGGAFLGLDPANPPTRNALLMSDADPVVVLTTMAHADDLSTAAAGRAILLLDSPAVMAQVASQPVQRLADIASPLSYAHVCYTSGSTGVPKGVGLSHCGIIRMAHDPDYLRTGPGETVAQLQPVAFDGSLVEIYGTLLNGGRLVVPAAGRLDIPDIADLVRANGVTTLGLTTAMFHQMAAYDAGALSGVRQMITGGDVLMPEAFTAPMRLYPGLTVINGYGPTENTVISTFASVTDPDEVTSRVPIGRPVRGTTVYVLDADLHPVPIGVTGELYTGGLGVARGYLNRPAATADRFLPDPFSPRPGARMYRTGDLARWRPDGMLDFMGRADNQVKIRGFRIEPGEIVVRLTRHPAVAEAVVVPKADPSDPSHKRLVAYLVPASGAQVPGLAEVRAWLQEALPAYMTPTAIVGIEKFPLNHNGKIDKDALPEPDVASGPGSAAPRTPVEVLLADLWATVLGVPVVGVHDNFFDIGGDSILSIRVAALARRSGIQLTASDIFEHQTIAELAEFAPEVDSPALEDQIPATGQVPLTPVQRAFLHSPGPHNHFNQSVLLQWRQKVDPEVLGMALDVVLAHHDALRIRVIHDGEGWRQEVCDHQPSDILEVAEAGNGTSDTALAIANKAQASLDISAGPLMRAVLLRGGEGQPDHVLIVVHHLAVDAVSWAFLLDDIDYAYRRLREGEALELPAKTTSFRAWARASVTATALGPGDGVPGASAATFLPVDMVSGPDDYASTRIIRRSLTSQETADIIRGRGRRGEARASDLLLAALARTLLRWAGTEAVTIDVEGHGRDVVANLDVSRTVGWFTTIRQPSFRRADVADPRTSGQVARESLLRAPLLTSEATLSQVSFNYLGQEVSRQAGDGVFSRLPDTLGTEYALDRVRPYLLEVIVEVRGGVMSAYWSYSANRHDEETINRLADTYLAEARKLASGALASTRSELDYFFQKPTPRLVARQMERYRVPGMAIAVVRGRKITAWSYGLSGAVTADEITNSTVFQLGSISKHLSAIAVLSLVRSGAVDLDQDVNRYLKGTQLRSPSLWPPVTLRLLLNHTAGLAGHEVVSYHPREKMPTVAEFLANGGGTRVVRRPGEEYEYSGTNYAIIEKVITDVTEMPFPAAMYALVLDPLGMADTSFLSAFPEQRGTATARGHSASGQAYAEGWRNFPSTGAGGMWSTPSDLARVAVEFLDAHEGRGKILDPGSLREMLGDRDNGYGLGVVVKTTGGARWFGHPGDTPGFRGLFALCLERREALVMFANGDAGTPLFEAILADVGLDLTMRVQGDRKFT